MNKRIKLKEILIILFLIISFFSFYFRNSYC